MRKQIILSILDRLTFLSNIGGQISPPTARNRCPSSPEESSLSGRETYVFENCSNVIRFEFVPAHNCLYFVVTRGLSHPTVRSKEICVVEGKNERCIGHKKMTAGIYTWVDFLLLSNSTRVGGISCFFTDCVRRV